MDQPARAREIAVFADYVCPFSYLSLRELERLGDELELVVERRAFELRPAPQPPLAGPTEHEWAVVRELARTAGIEMKRPTLQPRTRKAHEAVKFAATIGKAADLQRAIFDAHFVNGYDIGRIDVLVAIGISIDIDPGALKVALDIDAHTDAVLADAVLAEQLEIEGTPAFVAGSDVRIGYLSRSHLRDWLKD